MPRARWLAVVEASSILAFCAAWSVVIVRWVSEAPAGRLLWLLPLAAVVGFLVADFVGGCVHWLADTYFDPSTPVLGPLLIEPFRDHHRDPSGITRHGFSELLGNNALGTLPLAALLLAAGAPGPSPSVQLVHAAVSFLALALFATNAFHRWAHQERPPRMAGWLQRAGLVLSPEVHARHHRGEHDCSYCVTSGWLNPLLDRLGFFRGTERVLARVGVGRGRVMASARAGWR